MSWQPIRVLSVVEAYTVTGPARNLIRFARRAQTPLKDQRPVELSFVTFVRPPAGDIRCQLSNQFIEEVRRSGIHVDVIPESFRFDPRVIPQLAGCVRQHQPHIIQTHGIKAHFLIWVSRLNSGRKWIAFHHGYTAENAKMKLYNKLNRLSLPRADRVVTVCNPFADLLCAAGVERARIDVVPNSIETGAAVEPEQVQALRRQFRIRPNEQVLLSVGRFSSEKGHADLIPAMVQLVQALGPDRIRHVLVGDGIERGNIERLAASAGVADRFVFAGHQRNVRPFYALADVFVLPSHSEGSPNVLLEAMSAGVPVIATGVGGVPETVCHEKSALIIEPSRPKQLAIAVERLLADDALRSRLIATAADDIRTRFSPATYQRAIVKVYERLCPDIAPFKTASV